MLPRPRQQPEQPSRPGEHDDHQERADGECPVRLQATRQHGGEVLDGEGAQEARFSVNDRFFVLTIGVALHQALMRGLGTREPPC